MSGIGEMRHDDLTSRAIEDKPADRTTHQWRDRLKADALPARRAPERIQPLNQDEWRPYFFLFGACVNADAATLFALAELLGLLRILLAFDATAFDVRSFLLMTHFSTPFRYLFGQFDLNRQTQKRSHK